MNIVFASSDLYSKLAIVTIKSLLMNNMDSNEIVIYYIGDNITNESKVNLTNLVREYSRKIIFLKMPKEFNHFSGSNRNGQTVFCYCYFQDILPKNVDKVLLLEADTIVMGHLDEFYNINMNDYYIAAVDDMQSRWYKQKLGMKKESPYVNCGIVLYNLRKWREDNITEKITAVINSGRHMFFYDVQDVLNYTLEGYIKVVPPKFNCTSAVFLFDYKDMLRYRKPSTCCTQEEFESGKKDPIIVHFTKNQIIQPRPWIEKCEHPYSNSYLEVKSKTIINKEDLWKYNPGVLNKFAHFLYTRVSKSFAAITMGFIHAYLYPLFLYKILFRDR